MRVRLSLQEEKKRSQRGNLRLCFWAAISRLPLISSDRANNTAKRRHSVRPSTCQTVLDHIHVEDGRQTRPLAHGYLCQTARHLTQHDVQVRLNCFLDGPNADRNSACIGRNVGVVVLWWIRKSCFQILDGSDIRWNVFLCSIYWPNIQKKYIKMNHSNLALLKSHINRNIPTSFQSFGITETGERREPTALKSGMLSSILSRKSTPTHSYNLYIVLKKTPFFPLLVLVLFSFQQTVLSDEEGWDAQ